MNKLSPTTGIFNGCGTSCARWAIEEALGIAVDALDVHRAVRADVSGTNDEGLQAGLDAYGITTRTLSFAPWPFALSAAPAIVTIWDVLPLRLGLEPWPVEIADLTPSPFAPEEIEAQRVVDASDAPGSRWHAIYLSKIEGSRVFVLDPAAGSGWVRRSDLVEEIRWRRAREVGEAQARLTLTLSIGYHARRLGIAPEDASRLYQRTEDWRELAHIDESMELCAYRAGNGAYETKHEAAEALKALLARRHDTRRWTVNEGDAPGRLRAFCGKAIRITGRREA